MDSDTALSLTLAWLPVALTALATLIAWLGVKTAKDQAEIQRKLAKEAAQPYVWADVQADPYQGWTLDVVVQNNGPTVATNVVVRFDPPLPVQPLGDEGDDLTTDALGRLERGLRSLAPNKPLRWHLGEGPELLDDSGPQCHTVTITAEGPFGPVPTLEYIIDLSDFRESEDNPDGSLHLLTDAIEKGMSSIRQELRKRG